MITIKKKRKRATLRIRALLLRAVTYELYHLLYITLKIEMGNVPTLFILCSGDHEKDGTVTFN